MMGLMNHSLCLNIRASSRCESAVSATETNLVISRLRLMEATAPCWLIVVITSLLLKHAYGFQQFMSAIWGPKLIL